MDKARARGPPHTPSYPSTNPLLFDNREGCRRTQLLAPCWVSDWQAAAQALTINLHSRFHAGNLPAAQGQSSPLPWPHGEPQTVSQLAEGQQCHRGRDNSTDKHCWPSTPDKDVKIHCESYKYPANVGGLQLEMQVGMIKPADIHTLSWNNSYQAKVQI